MNTAPVIVERVEAVTRLVLNRPDASNALDLSMKAALLEALLEAAGDSGVRAVVLTGAGRAFCVGQDLGEHASARALGADVDTEQQRSRCRQRRSSTRTRNPSRTDSSTMSSNTSP